MLSYKLKHLCARVLASLSAFGIASISQRALADTDDLVQLNSEYTWSAPSNLAFMANYEVLECTTVANATYTLSNEGVCTYTCNEGYAVHNSAGRPVAYAGQSGDGRYLIRFTASVGAAVEDLSGCRQLDLSLLSCSATDTDAATGGGYKSLPQPSYRVTDDYVEKGCAWECNRGYATSDGLSGVTGADLTTWANGFVTLDTGNATGACHPIAYKVTYDCVGGVLAGEDGVTTKTEWRTYSNTFKVDKACEDTSGFFKGWTVTYE